MINLGSNFPLESSSKVLLYASCVPVKGVSRSIVCDLQQERFVFIPNLIYKILTVHRGSSLIELENIFPDQYQIVLHYFQLLYKSKYLFTTDTPELFPEIDLHALNILHNIEQAIVDIDDPDEYNVSEVIRQLANLGTRHIQIRCFRSFNIHFYDDLLDKCKSGHLEFVHLIIKNNESLDLEILSGLSEKYPFVRSIVIHACEENLSDEVQNDNATICFTKQIVDSEVHCGIIAPNYFSINTRTLSESQKYNSCLAGKIGIDKNGFIKNCPSTEKHFGHVNSTTLVHALVNVEFYKTWAITKDQIEVCRDCEFRYICTDCRAYTVNKDNEFSKPAKCMYDPYTMKGFTDFASMEEIK